MAQLVVIEVTYRGADEPDHVCQRIEDLLAGTAVAVITRHEKEIRTKSGRLMTNDEFELLADEAERGYDISHLIDPSDAI